MQNDFDAIWSRGGQVAATFGGEATARNLGPGGPGLPTEQIAAGLMGAFPRATMKPFFGNAVTQIIDGAGASTDAGANSWTSSKFFVNADSLDWMKNNLREQSMVFVYRKRSDLVGPGAPSSRMHGNLQPQLSVMSHISAINYELMRTRGDRAYPKSARHVHELLWFAGSPDSIPSIARNMETTRRGNLVNVVTAGTAQVMDIWTPYLHQNQRWLASLDMAMEHNIPNNLGEGTRLWFIVRHVALQAKTTRYVETEARIQALAGPGASALAIGPRHVRYTMDNVPQSIINDPSWPLEETKARAARNKSNAQPYHWCIIPFAMNDTGNIPFEFLNSDKPGGPSGYAISVGWAFKPITEVPRVVVEQKIASVIRPSFPGQWNGPMSSLSLIQIFLSPYTA